MAISVSQWNNSLKENRIHLPIFFFFFSDATKGLHKTVILQLFDWLYPCWQAIGVHCSSQSPCGGSKKTFEERGKTEWKIISLENSCCSESELLLSVASQRWYSPARYSLSADVGVFVGSRAPCGLCWHLCSDSGVSTPSSGHWVYFCFRQEPTQLPATQPVWANEAAAPAGGHWTTLCFIHMLSHSRLFQ